VCSARAAKARLFAQVASKRMAIRGSAPNALHLTVLMSSSSLIHSDHIFIPPPNSYSTAHLASWPLARVRSRCGSQLIVLGFPQLHNIGDIYIYIYKHVFSVEVSCGQHCFLTLEEALARSRLTQQSFQPLGGGAAPRTRSHRCGRALGKNCPCPSKASLCETPSHWARAHSQHYLQVA
jgi:hypothetical protein